MARKFVGMTRIVSRQSTIAVACFHIANLLVAIVRGRLVEAERRKHLQRELFSPPPGHDTRGVLRFHHYAIEDGRYHPSRA